MAKSHIIPEYFVRQLKGPNTPYLLSVDRNSPVTSRSYIGEYDQTILCMQCEALFNTNWDDYGIKFFQGSSQWPLHVSTAALFYYEISQFDYKKLKLFFLSLLWRAHVSTRPFFERVDLGCLAARAHEMLQLDDPGAPEEFTCLIGKLTPSKLHPNENFHKILVEPIPIGLQNTFYQFQLNEFFVWIKADNAPIDYPFNAGALVDNNKLWIIEHSVDDTPFLNWYVSIVQDQDKTAQKFKSSPNKASFWK